MAAHLVLLGPPASGKGTQGRRIASRRNLAYLSTGALLREVLAEDSEDADVIRPILNKGGYIPDDMMCRLITNWLSKHQEGWVIDGFPRTEAQADFLHDWMDANDMKLDAALVLEVSKDQLIQRIEDRVECQDCRWSGSKDQTVEDSLCPECGGKARPREDDSLSNFLSRYEKYQEHTMPLIDRYRKEGILLTCDASAPIDEVSDKIHQELQTHLRHGQTA